MHHTKKEEFPRRCAALASDLDLVMVPGVHKLLCVCVDCRQKEMMQQPNMAFTLWIKTVKLFQGAEENLPLLAKCLSDITP
jgi:hypothetical protein